jgi:hypothetical protein
MLVVFPSFGVEGCERAVNANVFRCSEVPESVLRGTAGTKMDDVLAAQFFSGPGSSKPGSDHAV